MLYPSFFLVNGYLILNKKEVTYTYTAKKILKILFLVVLWNLVYFLLKLVIKQQLENPIILVAESLIQEGFFWQFWFLGAMILTYLFAPLIHKVVNRFRYSYPLLLILTLLPCIIIVCFNYLSKSQLLNDQNFIQTFMIWKWLLYFILGGYLKHIIPWLNDKISFPTHGVLTAILFFGFPLYQLYAVNHINFNDYYGDLVAIANNTMIFTFFMRVNYKNKISRIVEILAPYSMGCYILHPIVLKFINRYISYSCIYLPFLIYPIVTLISFSSAYVLNRRKLTKYFVNL